MMQKKLNLKCWDIYMADIPKEDGCKQSGLRPVLIYSNQRCLNNSPYITIIPFTTKVKRLMPTHLFFNNKMCEMIGLKTESILICEQIGGLNSSYLKFKIGRIDDINVQFAIVKKTLIQTVGDYDLNFLTPEFLNNKIA